MRPIPERVKYPRTFNRNCNSDDIKSVAHLDSIRPIQRSEQDQLLKFESILAYTSANRPGKIYVKNSLATPSRADLLSFSLSKIYLDRIYPYIFNKYLLVDKYNIKHYIRKVNSIRLKSKSKNNRKPRSWNQVRSKSFYDKKNNKL